MFGWLGQMMDNDQHQPPCEDYTMNDEQNTELAAATDPQGRLDALVSRFATFVDGVEHSVGRAEEPHWCAVYLSAEDADDLLPAFREVLRIAQGG